MKNSDVAKVVPGASKILSKWNCTDKDKSILLGYDSEEEFLVMLSSQDQLTIQKNHPASCQLSVSIPDIAMDELAKGWCKYRKIEGI